MSETNTELIQLIRSYNELKQIKDDEILPYINMAKDEMGAYTIDESNQMKATAFFTLHLMGHKLWHRIQQRANEYDETLETFKDVIKWEEYWFKRFNNVTATSTSNSSFGWRAV